VRCAASGWRWELSPKSGLTDPDARSMAISGKGTGIVYNVQMAVDAEHHLIVAHEVTNIGNDRAQLTSIGCGACKERARDW
jgi:hypothetical protein